MNVGKELYWHEGSGCNLRCDFASIKQSLGEQETIRCAFVRTCTCVRDRMTTTACDYAFSYLLFKVGISEAAMHNIFSQERECLARKLVKYPLFNDDQSCLHTLLSNFYMWNILLSLSLVWLVFFVPL